MLNIGIYSIIAALLVFKGFFNKDKSHLILAFMLLFITQSLLLSFTSGIFSYVNYNWFHLIWNWYGKIASSLTGIAVIYYFQKKHQLNFGFTFKQQSGSLKKTLPIVLLCLLYFYFTGGNYNSNLSTETIMFDLTMPGIEEEIWFRGIFLTLLYQVFPKRIDVLGIRAGYPFFIVSILFFMVHFLFINNDLTLYLNYNAYIPLISGVVFCWLREKSGSLLIPVICHNSANLIINLF